MNIQQSVLQDMEVAYVSQQGSYLDTAPLWERLMRWAIPKGLQPHQHQYIGISYDEPEPPDDQKTSNACVVLPTGFDKSDPEMQYKTLAGGLFIRYAFYDTVERLGLAYKEVVKDYLPGSAYALDSTRDFLEFSLNNPFADPERKARIDLYVPVVAKIQAETL